ncbi:MAG: hypothetical protein Q7T76_14560 [Ferruginibacter sp.]|nr:hypothetical protein [Ferruginibacter sp.]
MKLLRFGDRDNEKPGVLINEKRKDLKPAQYLKDGDVVELSIEGLGNQQRLCINA